MERFWADAYPDLVAALVHHFGDVALAEDLAQDALVRACSRWDHVSQLSSPVGWTYRVGVNLGNSWFRRRNAERRARQRHCPARRVYQDPDVADRVAVGEALQALTAPQREAVVLRYFLGLSSQEAAEVLDSTAGAVRGLTHRAVQRLRVELDVDLLTEESTHVQ